MGEHAEIAVEGVGGVEVVGGGSGGAEGGGDFTGDDAALADAGHDDAIARGGGLKEEFDCALEGSEHGAVEAAREFFKSRGLDADEFGWTRGIWRVDWQLGHEIRVFPMLAELRGAEPTRQTVRVTAYSVCV